MFLGHTILQSAAIACLLNKTLPPGPSDPPGVFDKPLKKYYDYIIGICYISSGLIGKHLFKE